MGQNLNNEISEKILTAVFTVQHREQCGSLFNIYFSFDGRYIILFWSEFEVDIQQSSS